MDLHPVAVTITLVLLAFGALVSGVVRPEATQGGLSDGALRRRLCLVVLLRYAAGAVLAIVLAALLLDPPSRGTTEGPGVLGAIALLVAVTVIAQTTVVADALQRVERD